MIHGKRILAIVPARGGSKGIPRKNVREIGGKPLIAWTIEAAQKSKYIDHLVVSTEDHEIASVSRSYGAEVLLRPEELAQDDTPGIDVVLHAVEQLQGYSYVVLLQPTSPLRMTEDIDQCLESLVSNGAPACVSLCEVDQPPHWMYIVNEQNKLQPIVDNINQYYRRQEIPKTYALNGAIYVAETEWLFLKKSFLSEETLPFIMPRERSIDIDVPLDLEFVDFMLRKTR
mgnify:CR=1 FL=1